MSYRHWALPKERLFPIDTPALVKLAAASFDNQVDEMSDTQKLVAARSICSRAGDLGVHVESSLAFKYAGDNLSPFFAQFLALRKTASCHVADRDLDMLLELGRHFGSEKNMTLRVTGLDKIAEALASFDDEHQLVGAVPDAAYSVYGQTADRGERLRLAAKVADRHVTAEDLSSADFETLRGHVEDEVVDGLSQAQDRLTVFSSLPEPHREIVFQTLFGDRP